jgi:hypothetical protein
MRSEESMNFLAKLILVYLFFHFSIVSQEDINSKESKKELENKTESNTSYKPRVEDETVKKENLNQAERRVERKNQIIFQSDFLVDFRGLTYQYNLNKFLSFSLNAQFDFEKKIDFLLPLDMALYYQKYNYKREMYFGDTKFFFFEKVPVFLNLGYGKVNQYGVSGNSIFLENNTSISPFHFYPSYILLSKSSKPYFWTRGIGFEWVTDFNFKLGIGLTVYQFLNRTSEFYSYSQNLNLQQNLFGNILGNVENGTEMGKFSELSFSIGYAF